jgi:hypothetical protein
MVKRGPACKERTLSSGVTCGAELRARSNRTAVIVSREALETLTTLIMATGELLVPFCGAPGFMTIRRRQFSCRRRGFAV